MVPRLFPDEIQSSPMQSSYKMTASEMTVSRRETAGEPSDEPVPEIQSKPVSINTYGSHPGNPEQPREYLYLFLGAINSGTSPNLSRVILPKKPLKYAPTPKRCVLLVCNLPYLYTVRVSAISDLFSSVNFSKKWPRTEYWVSRFEQVLSVFLIELGLWLRHLS